MGLAAYPANAPSDIVVTSTWRERGMHRFYRTKYAFAFYAILSQFSLDQSFFFNNNLIRNAVWSNAVWSNES